MDTTVKVILVFIAVSAVMHILVEVLRRNHRNGD